MAARRAVAAPTSVAAWPRRSSAGVTGPGFTITLKKNGVKVRTLKAGKYTITVQDKSNQHNFRLKGPGLNKQITRSRHQRDEDGHRDAAEGHLHVRRATRMSLRA